MRKYGKLIILLVVTMMFTFGCGKDEKSSESSKRELEFSEIEDLAENCVFNVNWNTTEGEYMAGTAFVTESENHGKLLVTAFHYLVPDNTQNFSGSQLPYYVKGGDVYYAKTGEDTGAKLKNNLVITDADAVPNIEKDCAAFTLKNGENLQTLKLSDRKPKKGEVIYLLARLWDGDVQNADCVYPCSVVYSEDEVFTYKLDKKYGSTMGASGGPLVDKYGEVVGMHMAGDYSKYYGHLSSSFAKQIEYGFISDVEY